MNGTQDTNQTGTDTTKAPAIDVEVVGSETTSESASSPSAGESSATSGTTNEQYGLVALVKRPVYISTIATPLYTTFERLVAIFLLLWKGPRKWFPGIDQAKVNYTVGPVNYTDAEAYASGVILAGCGRRTGGVQTDSDEEEGGFRDTDISWTARYAEHMEIRDERVLKRIIDEAISSCRYNMPDTTLGEIVPLHPDWARDNQALMLWVFQALKAIVAFERMPTDIGAQEVTLIGFFESWASGRPNVPAKVVERMRAKMSESLQNWRDNRTELATIVHAFKATGVDEQSTMNWLCTAFDAIADNEAARLAERERLEQIQPVTIHAKRKLRSKQQPRANEEDGKAKFLEDEYNLLVVHDANKHTLAAAWSLGAHIVLAFRDDDERFAIFMHRRRTRGFGMKNLIRMLRYHYRARKGEIREAYAQWNEMGCEGEFPGIEGLDYDEVDKAIRNGSETYWAPKLRLPADSFVETIEASLDDDKRHRWQARIRRRWDTQADAT